jgi:cytochrome c peroxidase
MRFPAEASHGANNGLAIARSLLEPIKTKYGDELSYGDLWTLAGVVAIKGTFIVVG